MKVRDIMNRRVARILASEDLAALLRMLVRESISGVPVVEPDCRLVGVASVRDLLHRLARLLDENPNEAIATVLQKHQVSDIMTQPVQTVSPEMPASRLAALLRNEGIHRAFVIDEGRLCGVVTTYDLLRATVGAV
jgi:CBS-domain-containing membrane protein